VVEKVPSLSVYSHISLSVSLFYGLMVWNGMACMTVTPHIKPEIKNKSIQTRTNTAQCHFGFFCDFTVVQKCWDLFLWFYCCSEVLGLICSTAVDIVFTVPFLWFRCFCYLKVKLSFVFVQWHCVSTCVMQLISQQPVITEPAADTKATRAEAALTQLLVGDQQDLDVTLTTTFITSIETFQSNLASPDEFTSDEDLQRKLMVYLFFFILNI